MAKLITVLWRDIPSHIIARRGRETTKFQLSSRFGQAIHRAAMRAGKGSSDAYIADWRRVSSACGDDLDGEVRQAAARIEAQYSDEALERLAKMGGLQQDD